jgi:membrane dipeptidase
VVETESAANVPGPGEIPNIKAAPAREKKVAKSIEQTLNFSYLVTTTKCYDEIQMSYQIFDGHNDVLFRLFLKNKIDAHKDFLEGDNEGHLDLPRTEEVGFRGGFFAIYVPSPEAEVNSSDKPIRYDEMEKDEYSLPLPDLIGSDQALPIVIRKISLLSQIEKHSQGKVKICLSGSELENSFQERSLSVVMHIEGAECIDDNFYNLEALYRSGLRSIGPVWSRPTIFGEGVPFAFPHSPDTGKGLTSKGIELIKHCNDLKIIVDNSHLNEKGFWDIAKHSHNPLVATHSNVHQLCPHTRNLTNKQLDAIKETKGMVGVNFAPAFLRPDGKMIAETDIQIIVDHFKYFIDYLGEDCVGFGSDFDGAMMPKDLSSVLGMKKLLDLMVNQGFDEQLMTKLCHQNWIQLVKRTLS